MEGIARQFLYTLKCVVSLPRTMRIVIMGGWNIASGASVHSELIGRELAKNHDLLVMSFYKHSFHGLCLTREDEDYVVRCFTQYGDKNSKLDPTPFIKENYDIFIVEDLGMLPMGLLANIFPQIKKKAKTINIIHDGMPSSKPGFYKFDWDAIVCFDERYKNFLKIKYPKEKIHIIPYPSNPLSPNNKEKSRKQLNLPNNKKIILLFGRLPDYVDNYLPAINKLASKYDILLLVLSNNYKTIKKIRNIQNNNFEIKIIYRACNYNELYQCLYASDVLIYPKPSVSQVVISSTIFDCMGSLCPIIAYDSNFVSMFSDEIFKYKNNKELELSLTEVFEQGKKYKRLLSSVKAYLQKYSSVQVAKMFEKLFSELSGIK